MVSYLREHKFRHNFRDSLNPICNCGNVIEPAKHYFLHSSNFKNERQFLLQNVRIVKPNLLSMNENALTHLLLYGDNTLTDIRNTFLVNSFIEYITSTKLFNDSLIKKYFHQATHESQISFFFIFVFTLDFNLFILLVIAFSFYHTRQIFLVLKI